MHRVRVPATSANLGPGYDAFGAAFTLYLHAVAVPRADVRVVTRGEGAGEVATDDTNLVWTSFLAACAAWGIDAPEVSLEVDNAIPLERGLGSSSAAIVAGVALARAVNDIAIGDLDLARIATGIEGHPDNVVPAILGGVTVTAVDDAGEPVVRRAQPHPRLRPIALVPSERQNTREARGVLPSTLASGAAAAQAGRAGHVLAGLLGAWPVAPGLAGDLLHEPPRLEVMGPAADLIGELRGAGHHAWLSGAGPSVAVATAATGDPAPIRGIGSRHGYVAHDLGWDLGGVTSN